MSLNVAAHCNGAVIKKKVIVMEGQALIAWKLSACFLLSQQMGVKTVNQM